MTAAPYRAPLRALAKLSPRAPWWRWARALLDGTLLRVADRRYRHFYGIVNDPEAWARRTVSTLGEAHGLHARRGRRGRQPMTVAHRPAVLDLLAHLTQGGLVRMPADPPTAVVYTTRLRRVFDRWIFGDVPVRVAEVEPLYRAADTT